MSNNSDDLNKDIVDLEKLVNEILTNFDDCSSEKTYEKYEECVEKKRKCVEAVKEAKMKIKNLKNIRKEKQVQLNQLFTQMEAFKNRMNEAEASVASVARSG